MKVRQKDVVDLVQCETGGNEVGDSPLPNVKHEILAVAELHKTHRCWLVRDGSLVMIP